MQNFQMTNDAFMSKLSDITRKLGFAILVYDVETEKTTSVHRGTVVETDMPANLMPYVLNDKEYCSYFSHGEDIMVLYFVRLSITKRKYVIVIQDNKQRTRMNRFVSALFSELNKVSASTEDMQQKDFEIAEKSGLLSFMEMQVQELKDELRRRASDYLAEMNELRDQMERQAQDAVVENAVWEQERQQLKDRIEELEKNSGSLAGETPAADTRDDLRELMEAAAEEEFIRLKNEADQLEDLKKQLELARQEIDRQQQELALKDELLEKAGGEAVESPTVQTDPDLDNREIEELKEYINLLETENAELNRKVDERESPAAGDERLTELENRVRDLEGDKERLEDELDSLLASDSPLESPDLQKQMESLQQERDALAAKLQELAESSSPLRDMEEEEAALQRRIEELENEKSELAARLDAAAHVPSEEESGELAQLVQVLEEDRQQLARELEASRKQVEALEALSKSEPSSSSTQPMDPELANTLADLQEKIARLEEENNALREVQNDLPSDGDSEAVRRLEEEKEGLLDQLKESHKQIESLKRDLSAVDPQENSKASVSGDGEAEISHLKRELENAKEHIRSLEESLRLASQNGAQESSEALVKDLEERLNTLQREKTELQEKIDASSSQPAGTDRYLEDKIKSLEQENTFVTKELNEARARIEQLSNYIIGDSESEGKREHATEKIFNKEIDRLEASVSSLEMENQALRQQLENAVVDFTPAQLERMVQEADELKQSNNRMLAELNNSKAQIEELKRSRPSSVAQQGGSASHHLEGVVETLKGQLREAQARSLELESRLQDLSNLTDSQDSEDLKRHIQTLVEDNETLHSQMESFQEQQRKILDAEGGDLELETLVTNLKERISFLEDENASLQGQMAEKSQALASEENRFSSELQAVNHAKAALERELEKSTGNLNSLGEQLKELESNYEFLQQEYARKESEVAFKNNLVDRLRAKIEEGITPAGEEGNVGDSAAMNLALRKSRDKLVEMLNGLALPLFSVSDDYDLLTANKGLLAFCGCTKMTEAIGTKCYQTVFHNTVPCEWCRMEQVIQSEEPTSVSVALGSKGNERFVEITFFPIFDTDGTLIEIAEYVWDKTEAVETSASLNKFKDKLQEFKKTRIDDVNELNEIKKAYADLSADHKKVVERNSKMVKVIERLVSEDKARELLAVRTELMEVRNKLHRSAEMIKNYKYQLDEQLIRYSDLNRRTFIQMERLLNILKGKNQLKNEETATILNFLTSEFEMVKKHFIDTQKKPGIRAVMDVQALEAPMPVNQPGPEEQIEIKSPEEAKPATAFKSEEEKMLESKVNADKKHQQGIAAAAAYAKGLLDSKK